MGGIFMNKKQAGIIVTLLALIVCAGILAARVNGPLEVASNDWSTFSQSRENKSSTTDYFTVARLQREQQDAQTLTTYRSILDDENVSKAEKTNVEKKYSAKVTIMDQENKIETSLKAQGFEDVFCQITDEKVHVIVRAKDLNVQERTKIKDTVVSKSNIKNVKIEPRE
jgi:stage III sporulation protein AH